MYRCSIMGFRWDMSCRCEVLMNCCWHLMFNASSEEPCTYGYKSLCRHENKTTHINSSNASIDMHSIAYTNRRTAAATAENKPLTAPTRESSSWSQSCIIVMLAIYLHRIPLQCLSYVHEVEICPPNPMYIPIDSFLQAQIHLSCCDIWRYYMPHYSESYIPFTHDSCLPELYFWWHVAITIPQQVCFVHIHGMIIAFTYHDVYQCLDYNMLRVKEDICMYIQLCLQHIAFEVVVSIACQLSVRVSRNEFLAMSQVAMHRFQHPHFSNNVNYYHNTL